MVLCLFARQNRKSGWKRHRPDNMAESLEAFYAKLGVATTEEQRAISEWKPLSAEETIGFSAQMLKLRSALGASLPVTEHRPQLVKRELVHQ